MRQLDSKEVRAVSGGAFSFPKTAADIYNFLRSTKNPLNGVVIGGAIASLIGNIMYPFLYNLTSRWVKK